jgi:HlyD family secretion protein
MRQRLPRLALAAAVFVAAAVAYGVVELRPVAVEVARIERNVPIQVFGLGTVEARILSRVGFEVGATLVELRVDHGDAVRQGQVLARLHAAAQEARLTKARAGLVNAQAVLRTAEASLNKAHVVAAQAKQANRRRQALVARGSVSVEAAEESQKQEDVAATEVAVALAQADVARAAVQDAEAQLLVEQVLLDHHVLKAPYDALVVERHKELGAALAPGETLFTLVAPQTIWVRAFVDEARAGAIGVGQPAEVRLRSLPQEVFAGSVDRIGIESDRVSEERRVFVTCARCPTQFYLGEQAEVVVTTAVLGEALLVPEIAIEGFDGTKGTVWTIEEGYLARRELRFGERTLDARAVVRSGLPPGGRLVAKPGPRVREGRRASFPEAAAP